MGDDREVIITRLRKDIVLILERMLDGDEPEKHVIGFADEIIALLESDR